MNLKQLKEKGAWVDQAPVKKPIKWRKDGETIEFDVWVVRQPFGVVEEAISESPDKRRAAQMICLHIRLGDDAGECMSYDEAYRLEPSLAWEFVRAINSATVKN